LLTLVISYLVCKKDVVSPYLKESHFAYRESKSGPIFKRKANAVSEKQSLTPVMHVGFEDVPVKTTWMWTFLRFLLLTSGKLRVRHVL